MVIMSAACIGQVMIENQNFIADTEIVKVLGIDIGSRMLIQEQGNTVNLKYFAVSVTPEADWRG